MLSSTGIRRADCYCHHSTVHFDQSIPVLSTHHYCLVSSTIILELSPVCMNVVLKGILEHFNLHYVFTWQCAPGELKCTCFSNLFWPNSLVLTWFFFAVGQEKMPLELVQLVLWGVKQLISHLFAVLTRLFTSWQPVPERVPSGTSRPLLNALLMNSSMQQKGHLTGKKGHNHSCPYLPLCLLVHLSFVDHHFLMQLCHQEEGWNREGC